MFRVKKPKYHVVLTISQVKRIVTLMEANKDTAIVLKGVSYGHAVKGSTIPINFDESLIEQEKKANLF